jgi:F-type H+/Na+-transporting ATPase subunit alpha
VPLDQMAAAEQAVREAAADIPDEVSARLDGADKLSDEDRASIVEIGRAALEDYLAKAAPRPAPEQKAETTAEPDVEPDEDQLQPEPEATPKPTQS